APGAGFSAGEPFRPRSPNADSHSVAAEQLRDDSLLAWYRRLLALRNGIPALARGSYAQAHVAGQTWSYQRVLGRQTALVLINYGAGPASIELEGLAAGLRLRAQLPGSKRSMRVNANGRARLRLPPRSVAVYLAGGAP
ncbi:MAG: DUF3459 domain-containing protein, partial [Arenimonas sp.]